MVKNEMRYLKVILEIKDQRLLFLKKGLEELTNDLKSMLSMTDCAGDCQNISRIAEPTAKKRKLEETSHDTQSNFSFSDENVWVAVAYEEDFFIGQTRIIHSRNLATIQFLSRGPKGIFCWPRVEDIDKVEAE